MNILIKTMELGSAALNRMILGLLILLPLTLLATPHWDGTSPRPENSAFWQPSVAKDGVLYAAADHFDGNGGVSTAILKWMKCNGWQYLGVVQYEQQINVVTAMCLDGDNLYVGGSFTNIGGVAAKNIARCNLLTGVWSIVGNNLLDGPVWAIAVNSTGEIYVGAGGVGDRGVSVHGNLLRKWDGMNWVTVGGGMVGSSSEQYGTGQITALAAAGTNIYAGGYFDAGINSDNTTRINSTNLIIWTGSEWKAMTNPPFGTTGTPIQTYASLGIGQRINKIVVAGTNVFVVGTFTTDRSLLRYSTEGNLIRKYDLEEQYTDPEVGVVYFPSAGFDLAVQGEEVYVAGKFTHIDQTPITALARWENDANGGTWSAIGGGITWSGPGNTTATSLAVDVNASTPGNALYVFGQFDAVGGSSVPVGTPVRWVLGTDNVNCGIANRISAGGSHSLAIKYDGTVWAWGWNAYGQLGDGSTQVRYTPVQVTNISQIVRVSAGGIHSLALDKYGRVWAWGNNAYGQLGDGTYTTRANPVLVLSDVNEIAAGMYHSLAKKSDGTVWAWGWNNHGQAGPNASTTQSTPVQVPVGEFNGTVAISAGFYHSLAMFYNGNVYAWGDNSHGQLGNGSITSSSTPVQVDNSYLYSATAISAGGWHSLALDYAGSVFAWGFNQDGQIGNGGSSDAYTPDQIEELEGVTAIDAGVYHSMAQMSGGTVYTWGDNYFGQLGDGTTTDRYSPVQVLNLSGSSVVSAGGYFSLSGVGLGISAWGANFLYHLGDGSNQGSSSPVSVSGFGF